jgi:hypothetical protein
MTIVEKVNVGWIFCKMSLLFIRWDESGQESERTWHLHQESVLCQPNFSSESPHELHDLVPRKEIGGQLERISRKSLTSDQKPGTGERLNDNKCSQLAGANSFRTR